MSGQDGLPGVEAFYDATATQWADKWYADDSMLPLLRRFVQALPPNPRVLDAGCGAGYESMRLAALGAEVVGVDFSRVSIDIARGRASGCRFEVGDCLALDPGTLGSFDGIVSIALLVHFDGDRLAAAFDSFRRVLRPGGLLLVAFVPGEGYMEEKSLVEVNGTRYNRAFYGHSEARMDEAAHAAGFGAGVCWTLPDAENDRWRYHVYRMEAT